MQFPIGIDSERFIHALEFPKVQEHIKELKERFAGRKVCSLSPSLLYALCARQSGACVFPILKFDNYEVDDF